MSVDISQRKLIKQLLRKNSLPKSALPMNAHHLIFLEELVHLYDLVSSDHVAHPTIVHQTPLNSAYILKFSRLESLLEVEGVPVLALDAAPQK